MSRIAIGAILPSANRVVERGTAAILQHLPGIGTAPLAHLGRVFAAA